MDNQKYQYEGMKWLMELELLNNPQAVNTIKINILMTSNKIKEVELLIYRENKSMLVLLELTWMGRKFYKKRIFTEVQEVLNQLLPTFRFRITEDPKIMELAIGRVKQALTGGNNEKTSNISDSSNKQPDSIEPVKPTESTAGESGSSQSGAEEQSINKSSIRSETSPDDRKEEQ